MDKKILAPIGGHPAITAPLRKWRRYRQFREGRAVEHFIHDVVNGSAELSGYLAGIHKPGKMVAKLEEAWAHKFGVKHAIACNSATSGLLAACYAASKTVGLHFAVPALSMSATEVAPMFIGHATYRCDVDDWLCAEPSEKVLVDCNAALVTSLLGHPVQMDLWKKTGRFIIEDAAQAVLATDEHGRYAGTVGDVGVFSFNIHKQLNAGEGGMVVTNRDDVALSIRDCINHGECRPQMAGERAWGLNLRMTELTAVLVLCQLSVADELVRSRQTLRSQLVQRIPPPFAPIMDRNGCTSACYCLALTLPDQWARDYAVAALNAEGFPCRAGYAQGAFYGDLRDTPYAKYLNDRLILVEICAIDPTMRELDQIGEAFTKVGRLLNG